MTDQAKPSLDDLFAEMDAKTPLDQAGLYALFDRMKLLYPEAIASGEVGQRMQAREDKARDKARRAVAEYKRIRNTERAQ